MQPVNLKDKFSKFSDPWSPKIVARVNEMHVKLVKVEGEFVWHSHPETDELFWVHSGELSIELRDGAVHLAPGELYVVPRGVEHRPVAAQPCEVVLLEPTGTANTGNAGGERTVDPKWI